MIVVYIGMRWLREVSMWTKKKGTLHSWSAASKTGRPQLLPLPTHGLDPRTRSGEEDVCM